MLLKKLLVAVVLMVSVAGGTTANTMELDVPTAGAGAGDGGDKASTSEDCYEISVLFGPKSGVTLASLSEEDIVACYKVLRAGYLTPCYQMLHASVLFGRDLEEDDLERMTAESIAIRYSDCIPSSPRGDFLTKLDEAKQVYTDFIMKRDACRALLKRLSSKGERA